MKLPEPCKLYAVRNREGKWFRSKGYGGYGDTWIEDFGRAKLYHKLGQARARVTFFSNRWPEYGLPDIVVFTITGGEVLGGEVERSARIKERRKKTEAKAAVREQEWAKERAERDLQDAQRRLAQLTGNPVH
jgi:hypothetical protein